MNEKQLIRISILGSVITLILIFIFVSSINPVNVKIGDIGVNDAGKTVNITGVIRNLNMKNGNVFFTLSDETGEIQIVLWSNVMKELEIKGVNQTSLKDGMSINMEGTIDIYKGQLQIVPAKSGITIIG